MQHEFSAEFYVQLCVHMCLLVHNTIYIESRKSEKHFSRKLLLERVLFLTHTEHIQL